MQRLFRRLSTVESISRRLRLSFRMLVILLVVPAVISIAAMLSNNMRYNDIIAHMGQVGDLKPKVAVDIPDEAWSAVAGYEAFSDVRLFEMIHEVNMELDVLMGTMTGPNQLELTAARRAMDTLREKVVERPWWPTKPSWRRSATWRRWWRRCWKTTSPWRSTTPLRKAPRSTA